jgi:hypothetical protein
MAIRNAKEYTNRLDMVAAELEKVAPELAMHVDMISDVLEGTRSASTLQFDPDEARFMAGRFNFNTRQRDADEGRYMDDFNKSNFEQVKGIRQNPTPIKLAYQKA